MNDPREMIFNKESGVMMEQDNRREEIYQWGAMQVDLCNLPVEDYMRPLKVEVIGSSNPETGTTLYKLTFVVDGDEVYTQELQRGDLIPFNEISGEKEGRNFKGWYLGTTQYSEGSKMPGRNLILTAKYECEVSFVYSIDGEETIVSSYTVTYNSKPTRIPSTNKDGYNFIGWEPSTTEPVTAHTTYVGTFEIKKFTVTWSGYTDGPILEEYKYGDTLNVPTKSPEKEGYTFKEWTPLIKEEAEPVSPFCWSSSKLVLNGRDKVPIKENGAKPNQKKIGETFPIVNTNKPARTQPVKQAIAKDFLFVSAKNLT
jgi:hypothetical protein